jgi:glutamate racemase
MFDSGVGGLSVALEVRRGLPAEDLVYVADAAHCPYGDRPAAEVRARALAIGRHLESAGAKLLIVACNTATGAALEDLRAAVRVPAVGLEPAVKTAAARTRRGRIGVLATAGTLASERFARLVRDHAQGTTVVAQACPGLVELIEEGELDGPRLRALLERLTAPLRGALAAVLGDGVELIDSAPAIARRAQSLLDQAGLRASGAEGSLRLLTTGDPRALAASAERLAGRPLAIERLAL